jgi:hypothetical protein
MAPSLDDVDTRISTQIAESLNSLKAKAANKNFNYTASWFARCSVAILRMNEGLRWIAGLRHRVVGEPMDKADAEAFMKQDAAREAEARIGEARTTEVARCDGTEEEGRDWARTKGRRTPAVCGRVSGRAPSGCDETGSSGRVETRGEWGASTNESEAGATPLPAGVRLRGGLLGSVGLVG